jgi:hypothetical protein
VWRYLAEHPEINKKHQLPNSLYKKIKFLKNECPLCGIFYRNSFLSCPGCPLSGQRSYCCSPGRPYNRWRFVSSGEKERKEAAEEIVRVIEAWDVDNDV